jgi:hypothetical protein
MGANVRKRAEGAACIRADETSVAGTGATGTADRVDVKTGSETAQSRTPWPAEFGWDFPFDFPKPTR